MTDVVHPERAAGAAITELLAGFIQELRQAGLPVSLTENLDAMQAVKEFTSNGPGAEKPWASAAKT